MGALIVGTLGIGVLTITEKMLNKKVSTTKYKVLIGALALIQALAEFAVEDIL